jgi:hypothetical protein
MIRFQSPVVRPRKRKQNGISASNTTAQSFLLCPLTSSGCAWIERHIGADNGYQPYYPTVILEPRYIDDVLGDIRKKGMVARCQAAPDAWKEICQLHLKEWVTPGQRDKLQAEYDAGIATGKSWREIGTALGQIVKGWKRGR